MKIDTKTMLEAFEETGGRGDVLSIPLEKGAALTALPKEMFADILYPLFQWWVNGTCDEPSDARDRMMLEDMKRHQTANAIKRKAFLVAQSEKWKKSVETRKNGKENLKPSTQAVAKPWTSRGLSVVEQRVNQVKAKAKAEAKAEAKAKASDLASVGDGASRAIAAPPTPISVKEAQNFLAMNAPQISTLPGMRTANGQATVLCMTLISGEIDKAVEAAGNRILDRETEDDYENTYNTFDAPIISMAERMDAIGKESEFRRILAKAMVDSEDDEVDNPAAFVMSRCKKGMEAIRATAGK